MWGFNNFTDYHKFMRYLFMQLFNVSHLMLDFMHYVLDKTDGGDTIILDFITDCIKEEYTAEDLRHERKYNTVSVLGELSNDRFEQF